MYRILLFVLITSCASQKTLMSYNIRNAKGMDNKTDYDRIAAVIKNSHADIIGLQELDSMTKRSDSVFVVKLLAEKTGYHYAFASAIKYQGGAYGVGILSKQKPVNTYHLPLPGKEEQRVLLIAEFDKYVVFNTHLSLTEPDRVRSVAVINEEVKKFTKPVFLLGDLNAEPSSGAIHSLQQTWTLISGTDFSFPADKPNRCIDYIFLGGASNSKLKHHSVLNEPLASDHRPVIVKLSLGF